MGGLVQICKIHNWKSTTWALVTCMAWLSVFRGHIREQTTKLFGHESFCLFNGFQKKVKPKKQVVGIKSKSNYAHLRLTKPLKIGHSQRNISSSNHWFSGAMLVSGRMNNKIEAVQSPIYGNPSCSIGNASCNGPFPVSLCSTNPKHHTWGSTR